ncbi:hexosyltransferase Agl6 [Halobacterium hubeiense]|uniref:Hexosyltransferase Agl6 n=1 Tax=Halobacterium hubeiense TaxID=1407499 RepID=A0A0U5H0V1_9EURY|nr:hexosyltransferase Agl6 [Halobacterium hubeiense]
MSSETTSSKPPDGGHEGEPVNSTLSESLDMTTPQAGQLLPADSESTPAISIVMPTMNEEEGIRECIERATNALEELGVTGEIIISDASTDRTPDIAESMGAIVVEPDKPGYGYAYRYAFDHARGSYIVMGDADTTYDFEEIPKLLELVAYGDADIVMGSRLEGEIKDGAMPPLHEHIGNPLLTKFLNAFYDAGVSDAHSGFRVFSQEALEALELGSDGMEFASEMIMDAGAKDLTIEEVPITYHEREGEAKLESFHDGWRHVKFMLVNAPGYLFSLPGSIMGAVGVVVMALSVFNVEVMGQSIGVHSLIAGSLLTLAGYQVGSFGFLTDVASDPIQRPDGVITQWLNEHFTLERGVLLGLGLFAFGSLTALGLLYQWAASGFTTLPSITGDIVAFTAIVLGLQTMFGAFFAGILIER